MELCNELTIIKFFNQSDSPFSFYRVFWVLFGGRLHWTTKHLKVVDSIYRLKVEWETKVHDEQLSPIQSKSVIGRFLNMPFNVVSNHLIHHLPYSATKVASGPDILSPVTFSQVRKLLLKNAGWSALDFLHELTGWQMRRNRNEQIDMISAHITFLDQQFQLKADLSDDLTSSDFNLSCQNMIAILCHPYKMILDNVHCVGTFTVFHKTFFSRRLYH